jgi:hypothetical protein
MHDLFFDRKLMHDLKSLVHTYTSASVSLFPYIYIGFWQFEKFNAKTKSMYCGKLPSIIHYVLSHKVNSMYGNTNQ